MSESLQRIIKRDEPKADIFKGMTQLFFNKTNVDQAIITIKENRNTRTGRQNNLYWGVIIKEIVLETRNSQDAIHDHLREELLEVSWETVGKRSRQVLKSTKTMNTKEMGLYIGDCIDYVQGELLPGYKLKLPDDWRELTS